MAATNAAATAGFLPNGTKPFSEYVLGIPLFLPMFAAAAPI